MVLVLPGNGGSLLVLVCVCVSACVNTINIDLVKCIHSAIRVERWLLRCWVTDVVVTVVVGGAS